MPASVHQVRSPIARFYQWQINVNGYRGPNPAADLKFFVGKQPSKKARKRDTQWFRKEEAQLLLKAAKALKPRWYAFLIALRKALIFGEPSGDRTRDPLIKSQVLYRSELTARAVILQGHKPGAMSGRLLCPWLCP